MYTPMICKINIGIFITVFIRQSLITNVSYLFKRQTTTTRYGVVVRFDLCGYSLLFINTSINKQYASFDSYLKCVK